LKFNILKHWEQPGPKNIHGGRKGASDVTGGDAGTAEGDFTYLMPCLGLIAPTIEVPIDFSTK